MDNRKTFRNFRELAGKDVDFGQHSNWLVVFILKNMSSSMDGGLSH